MPHANMEMNQKKKWVKLDEHQHLMRDGLKLLLFIRVLICQVTHDCVACTVVFVFCCVS